MISDCKTSEVFASGAPDRVVICEVEQPLSSGEPSMLTNGSPTSRAPDGEPDIWFKGRWYEHGLEPLDALEPERHARRVMAMFQLTPAKHLSWDSPRFVYFAEANSGAIKIGSSYAPKGRIRGIQSSMPEKVTLLCYLPGSYDRERYLHGVYQAEHIRGEWFDRSPRLSAMIDLASSLGEAA